MIDVDEEAGAQQAFVKGPRKYTAAARMAAVERVLTDPTRPLHSQYKQLGVSGSTFYFWRCEYVLRRYAEDLEEAAVLCRNQLDEARRHNLALQAQLASMQDELRALKRARAQAAQGLPPVDHLASQLRRIALTLQQGGPQAVRANHAARAP